MLTNDSMRRKLTIALKPTPNIDDSISRYAPPPKHQDAFRKRTIPPKAPVKASPESGQQNQIAAVAVEPPPPPVEVESVASLEPEEVTIPVGATYFREATAPEPTPEPTPEPPPHSVSSELANDENDPQGRFHSVRNTEAAVAPPPVQQANMQWLERQTPYTDQLAILTNPARFTRSSLAFELENLRNQLRITEDQALNLQIIIEQKTKAVEQIDDYLAACALVAEQSEGIKQIVIAPSKAKQSSTAAPRMITSSEDLYSTRDCLAYFEKNPNTNISLQELVEHTPAGKRVSAKKYVSQRAFQLKEQGKIRRVMEGVYRLDSDIAVETTPTVQ